MFHLFSGQLCFVDLRDRCLSSQHRLLALAFSTGHGGAMGVCGIHPKSNPPPQVYGFLSPLLTKTHNRNHTHPRAYISMKLQPELHSVLILSTG